MRNAADRTTMRDWVTSSGDRKTLDVLDIVNKAGSAGLAIDKSDVELANAKLRKTVTSNAKMLDQLATAVAICSYEVIRQLGADA